MKLWERLEFSQANEGYFRWVFLNLQFRSNHVNLYEKKHRSADITVWWVIGHFADRHFADIWRVWKKNHTIFIAWLILLYLKIFNIVKILLCVSTKCLWAKCPQHIFGGMSVGEISCRLNVCRRNGCRRNILVPIWWYSSSQWSAF